MHFNFLRIFKVDVGLFPMDSVKFSNYVEYHIEKHQVNCIVVHNIVTEKLFLFFNKVWKTDETQETKMLTLRIRQA